MPSYSKSRHSSTTYYTRPHSSSSSYYSRRPRDGYVRRAIEKIKRLLRDLYYYMRQHPIKVLLPALMALISGGALAGLAKRFGFTLPRALANLGDGARTARGGYDAFYSSEAGEAFGRGGDWGGIGTGGILKSALKVASAFL